MSELILKGSHSIAEGLIKALRGAYDTATKVLLYLFLAGSKE